jgi:copper chaperone CopZ
MLKLRIVGMDCYSCSLVIRKTVAKAPGVLDIGINYMMDLVHVKYDPAQIEEKAILELVRKSGYEPIPIR